MNVPDFEMLAELEHIQWATLTNYILNNISPENIVKWKRQIATPYAELSEDEKEKDRKWADSVVEVIEYHKLDSKMPVL